MKIIERFRAINNKKYSFWLGYDKDIVEKEMQNNKDSALVIFIESKDVNKTNNVNNKSIIIKEVPNGYTHLTGLINKYKFKFNQTKTPLFGIN